MSVFICKNRNKSVSCLGQSPILVVHIEDHSYGIVYWTGVILTVQLYVDIFNAEKLCYGHMQLFTQTPLQCEKRFVSEVVLKDSYFDSPVSTF